MSMMLRLIFLFVLTGMSFQSLGKMVISVEIYHYDVSQNTHHEQKQYGYIHDGSLHIPARTNIFTSKTLEENALDGYSFAFASDLVAPKSTLQANKAAGAAFERQVMGQLQKTQSGVVQQVTVKTQSGIRTRLDMIGRDASGAIRCTECKASATAPLTRNQRLGFPEIQSGGGVVVGKGKPGFPGGTQIPPTRVDIIRP